MGELSFHRGSPHVARRFGAFGGLGWEINNGGHLSARCVQSSGSGGVTAHRLTSTSHRREASTPCETDHSGTSERRLQSRASWGVRGLPRGSLSIYLSIPPDRRAARYARARRRHAGVQLHRTACARAVCKLLQPLHLRLVRVQRVRPGKRLRWTTEHSVWCTVHGGAPTPACPVACHCVCAELRRARSGATHKPATWKTAASARS